MPMRGSSQTFRGDREEFSHPKGSSLMKTPPDRSLVKPHIACRCERCQGPSRKKRRRCIGCKRLCCEFCVTAFRQSGGECRSCQEQRENPQTRVQTTKTVIQALTAHYCMTPTKAGARLEFDPVSGKLWLLGCLGGDQPVLLEDIQKFGLQDLIPQREENSPTKG